MLTSEELRSLILSMLHLNPNERPRIKQILALPICQNALLDLQVVVLPQHVGIGVNSPQASVGQLGPMEIGRLSLSQSGVRVKPMVVVSTLYPQNLTCSAASHRKSRRRVGGPRLGRWL